MNEDDVQRELGEIEALRRQGLITQETADRRRQEVLREAGRSDAAPAESSLSWATPVAVAELPGAEPARPAVYLPVRLQVPYPERLSRLALFVKLPAAIPLYIWLAVYGIVTLAIAFFAMLAVLFTGRYPLGLFNFVKGYVASEYRVFSYILLLTDKWTPNEAHPVQLEVDSPEHLSRLVLIFVKLPSMIFGVAAGLAGLGIALLWLLAFPVWFIILITGRYPRRLFGFARAVLQWSAGIRAWQFLMRDDWSLFGRTKPVLAVSILGAIIFPVLSILLISGVAARQAGNLFGVDDAEVVLQQFMEAGRDRDQARAIALTDPETPASSRGLAELFANRPLFDGFQDVNVKAWYIQTVSGGDTVLRIQAEIVYASGPKGITEAFLVKRAGVWKLLGVQVARP